MVSSDSVLFYVHSRILLCASENGFRSLLLHQDQSVIVAVPENSTVFNIVLRCIYNISCAHYCPSFDDLVTAVIVLHSYGVQPKKWILPSTPLYELLLSHAPVHPLELYTLAASYDVYDVAVSVSSHLLSFSLSTLTDDLAKRIGPAYLKRLFFLHFGRIDALKRLLHPDPRLHIPTARCDFMVQKKLTRAWALASASLVWDARPGVYRAVQNRVACHSAYAWISRSLNECDQGRPDSLWRGFAL
jgi:hypothetical protein